MSIERPSGIESHERGRNVDVTLTIVRHTQKEMGHSVSEDGGIAMSPVSEGGRERARFFGKMLRAEGSDPKVIGTTYIPRSVETAEEILEGAQASDRKVRSYMDFGFRPELYRGSPYFYEMYGQVSDKKRDEFMAEHHPGQTFEELSTDEQEQVMSVSDEAGVEWFLSHGDGPLRDGDPTVTARGSAALGAYQIQRFINLVDRMKSGSKEHYVAVSHQLIPEPLLLYILLEGEQEAIDEKELDLVAKLRRLGGSLQILDNFDVSVTTDAEGKKNVHLRLRGNTYRIDLAKLAELAEAGRELIGRSEQKIDQP